MVSAQITGLTKANARKAFNKKLILPMGPPDVLQSEHVEFDFSDVFGPNPTQTPVEVNVSTSENAAPPLSDSVYNDPMVILNRSHSLVGPTTRVSQSLRLSKLTLHESESSLHLIECSSEGTGEEEEEGEAIVQEDAESEKAENVGLKDFDVLKVVGQGAFGKVFQVMKKGTSEIYAMKVMRKDKIMEKNHAEYMKAERDILTKIDHPFVIQLIYSFQTKYRLYIVLDFVKGGHLFFQLYHHGLFSV